jgi:hypothetical protein
VVRARHISTSFSKLSNCVVALSRIKFPSIKCVSRNLCFTHSSLKTAGDVYVNHEGSHPLFYHDDFLQEVVFAFDTLILRIPRDPGT